MSQKIVRYTGHHGAGVSLVSTLAMAAGLLLAPVLLPTSLTGNAGLLWAACSPSNNGTPGNDVILCDTANNPAGVNVSGRDGDDTITLSGTAIARNINGNNNDDLINLIGGTVTRNVSGGNGADTIDLNGTTTVQRSINGGADVDIINLISGTVNGSVNWGTGAESGTLDLTNVTLGGSLIFGDDTDVFTLSAGTVGRDVFLGVGSNSGTGDDIFTLAGGTVTRNIYGDGDQDTININSGSVGSNVYGRNGDDVINLTGGTVTRDIRGDNGNDTITLDGSAIVGRHIFGGADVDTINLVSGTVNGNVNWGAGDESGTLDLSNVTLAGSLFFGTGTDVFTLNAGTVGQHVYLGAGSNSGTGDDIFTLAGGTVGNNIYGDADQDTINIDSGSVGGTVLGRNGDDGFSDNLILQGLSVTAPGANLSNWENIIVNGGMLGLTGTLDVGTAGEVATGLTVTNAGVVDMGTALTVSGNVTVDAGAIVDATGGGAGVYGLNGNITNNGLITTQDGVVGDVVTINGDYSGSGQLNVDVELGDSTSPSDQIIINGDVTGTTTINVTNVGGAGALTGTGPSDGIQIVDVNGTTTSGAFVLGGPVSVGAFNYGLVQGNDQGWYLQTALQGQVYGYSALQAVLGDDLETLWQRVGQRQQLLNRDGSVNTSGSGFWTRTSLTDTSAEGKTSVGGVGVANKLHYSRNLVQLGYDQQMFDDDDGKLVAGIFGHYKRLNLDIDDATGSSLAKADADGYGGGFSATWYSASGLYADLIGQVTMWDDKARASSGSGSFDALTYSASAETGYRFNLDNNARLVPQAQIVWRGSKYDKFTDSSGLAVNWNEKDAFTGRIGIALEGGNAVSKGGNGLTGYVIANLVHDFSGSGSLSAAGTNVKTELNRTRDEGRMGANLSGGDGHWTFYGEAGIASAISGKDYTSFKGIFGARWSF